MPAEGGATSSSAVADNDKGEDSRRRFLIGATGAVGGVSGMFAAAPFVSALRPSRKTQAEGAPVKAGGVLALNPGELRTVVWRLKPVWIFGRDAAMNSAAEQHAEDLSDPNSDSSLQPEYCKNAQRSIKPNVFVAVGLCTHLGCSPGRAEDGGFLCACHGSRFDTAGRVFRGSPAPNNLIVPPHYYLNDDEVIIGEDADNAA